VKETPLARLIEHGQSYWLDNLTRGMIRSGALERRVRDQGLRGVTSNPAIFHKAIGEGTDYDRQIAEAARAGHDIPAIYEALTTTDVRDACDVLRPVYDESDGRDGFVSLEVSPRLAHDVPGTIAEAQRLARRVDRPNCMIKIPGLPAAIPAIEQCLYEGININITLLFGSEAYEAVAAAYVGALERRLAAGRPIDRVCSVASFFLSRIDVLCDELLGHHVAADEQRATDLMGRAAVANARLAYQAFRRILATERWQALAAQGAAVQRMLWASTSTKNPLYQDVMYVEPLIGPDTVNTLPDATIEAFADHGVVAVTVEEGIGEARAVMAGLEALGIDLRCVVYQLQNEGVRKFIEPYEASMRTLEEKVRGLSGS
jgi:transaldolase